MLSNVDISNVFLLSSFIYLFTFLIDVSNILLFAVANTSRRYVNDNDDFMEYDDY